MNNNGFSLIELIVAIVVIGIGIAAFAQHINSSTINSIDPMVRQQANAVARAYLEEISLKSFCDPTFDPDANPSTGCTVDCTESACAAASVNTCGGPNGPTPEGTTRAIFDDVCDYTNLPDNLVRDQVGNLITVLSDYRVNVSVVDNAGADLNGLTGAGGRSLRIDINVTHTGNSNVDVTVTGYRTNF